jgi:hypothetical protein
MQTVYQQASRLWVAQSVPPPPTPHKFQAPTGLEARSPILSSVKNCFHSFGAQLQYLLDLQEEGTGLPQLS